MTTVIDMALGQLYDYGTPTGTGSEGQVYFDNDYIYIWIDDEWKKTALMET